MNPVIQEEPTGCGIAAVANILGRTYPQMKEIANAQGIHAEDQALWSDTRYVRRLLGMAGLGTSEQEHPFTSWENLPDLALLPIKHHMVDGKHFWHWTVFIRQAGRGVVLDSASYLAEPVRTDFSEMHPKWFIEVHHK